MCEREGGSRTPTCNAFLATLDTLLCVFSQPACVSQPCTLEPPYWAGHPAVPPSRLPVAAAVVALLAKFCCCLLPRQQNGPKAKAAVAKEIGNLILFSCFSFVLLLLLLVPLRRPAHPKQATLSACHFVLFSAVSFSFPRRKQFVQKI